MDVHDDLHLVLVFDEVSGLGSNSLQHLCSALSEFTDVFAVFIDTVSSISLLAPQRKMHPSGRVSIRGMELFHPFSALSCYHAPFDHSRCVICLELFVFYFCSILKISVTLQSISLDILFHDWSFIDYM